MMATVPGTTKSVPMAADDLACIGDGANMIIATTVEIDGVAMSLDDLADPRVPLPDVATLRERLREWADALHRTSEYISTEGHYISGEIGKVSTGVEKALREGGEG